MGFNVSTDELKSFHSIDRELYTRVVTDLRRNPTQAMEVMAFWFWLEKVGFPCIVLTLRSLPDHIVNAVFDEAVTCLAFMESDNLPEASCNATLKSYVKERLQFLHDNRAYALHGISKSVTQVFARVFEDIVKQAADCNEGIDGGTVNAKERTVERNGPGQFKVPVTPLVPNRLHALSKFQGFRSRACYKERNAPKHRFEDTVKHCNEGIDDGTVNAKERTVERDGPGQSKVPVTQGFRPRECYKERNASKHHFEDRKLSNEALNSKSQFQDQNEEVSPDDRAMFMTFSTGYPIFEKELGTYLLRSYGDVIEAIHMEKTLPYIQPLYARVVFQSPTTIDTILNGVKLVKFVINGKEVWARRFVSGCKGKEVWARRIVPRH